jgi:hypothetical protein
MFFDNLFTVQTYIPLYHCVFFSISFFFNFVICKLCQFFPFFEHFFSQIHTIETNFPNFFKKNWSHSAKIHQEKSLLCTEFLLFFHSEFLCYDCPCNFSFYPQAPPIVAIGQGEPAPTNVHSPSSARPLRGCICPFRDHDFV